MGSQSQSTVTTYRLAGWLTDNDELSSNFSFVFLLAQFMAPTLMGSDFRYFHVCNDFCCSCCYSTFITPQHVCHAIGIVR